MGRFSIPLMNRTETLLEGIETEMADNQNDNYIDLPRSFFKEFGCIYRAKGSNNQPISNFLAKIISQKIIVDEGKTMGRMLQLQAELNGFKCLLDVSSRDFHRNELVKKLIEALGPGAKIYGSPKDLRIGIQELSDTDIPEKIVTTSVGFTPEGNYLSTGMLITPSGIRTEKDIEVHLSGCKLSTSLGFLHPQNETVREVGRHILDDYLELKSHDITYPLIAHICLAPFSSLISHLTGKRKPAMHLSGDSGNGKTFIAGLGSYFFGDFKDHSLSLISTSNAIEQEGFYFRDTLFLVDDFKPGIINRKDMIRIIQQYTEEHGRARMNQHKTPYIRGMLLTTGEGFVDDVESITGRTLLLHVPAEKKPNAGKRCWKHRKLYRMLMPEIIHTAISRKNWQDWFSAFVEDKIDILSQYTPSLPNGLRVASNWALNCVGFEIFLYFLLKKEIINETKAQSMRDEHLAIVKSHIFEQALKLQTENPVDIFVTVISEKFATSSVTLSDPQNTGLTLMPNLNISTRGRVIGVVKNQAVYLMPTAVMELLNAHFKAVGQQLPFTRNALSKGLVERKLISTPNKGRHTIQIRYRSGKRFQAWEFSARKFGRLFRVL